MAFDVFISYRRENGLELARVLKSQLESLGVKVFLDLDKIRTGPFNEKIYQSIDDARYFLFIMTEGALERCANDGDWVRNELEYAHKEQKVIVPVCNVKDDISYPDNLPETLLWLPEVNVARIDFESMFEATIKSLVREYLKGVSIRDDEREKKNIETFLKRARRFKNNDYRIDAQERAELNQLAQDFGMDVSLREELIEQVESEFEAQKQAGINSDAKRKKAEQNGEKGPPLLLKQFAPFDGFLYSIQHTFDFCGLSGRAEFWGFLTVTCLLCFLSIVADLCLDEKNMFATILLLLLLALSNLALIIRRTRDCGHSPWLVVLFIWAVAFFPFVLGPITLLYLGLHPSKKTVSACPKSIHIEEGSSDPDQNRQGREGL